MGSGVSVLVCGLSGGFQRLGVELLRHEFWERAHEDRELCHGLFGGEDDDNRIHAMRKPRLALAGDSNAFLV